MIVQCLGGWCRKRDECAHYWAPTSRSISERLCPKGIEDPEPMRGPVNQPVHHPLRIPVVAS